METEEQILTRFDDLKEFCKSNWDGNALSKFEKAFQYARLIIGENKFKTGEVILNHSLEVATIIAMEIGLEPDSVITGMLHNVMYAGLDKKATHADIEKEFGTHIFSILDGISKINALSTETVDIHSENYRKLLLALAGDVRVIIIKIADRLQVMRNLELYDVEGQKRMATETSHLYAPLAHRLGLHAINSELQDLCLKFEKPDAFNYVVQRLKETEKERAGFVAEFVKPVEKKLKKKGFTFSMKARTKSIFSIWNKMQKKDVSFDEVMDLFAIRIILDSKPEDEKSDCWIAYSFVTEEYQTNPDRLRDWISIPKSNGYESLHTTVLGPQGKWVEIQIRTRRMDDIAEKGLAAHWKYKGGKESSGFDSWLVGIRDILENPELSVIDFIDQFRLDIYSDEIFVFTPKGDLKKLPQGATMLDFAYDIHSQLGDTCMGGKVNGKKVTLKYKLKNGDQITIDTSNSQKPKLDWLDFLVTSKAKNKVKASLNEERNNQAAQGREILIRKFKNWKIDLNDDAIRKILKKYGFKLAVDFYYDLAIGKIDALDVKSIFTEKVEENAKLKIEEILPKKEVKDLTFDGGDDFLVIDNNLKNMNYKLAPCCNPVFGDSIYGFVTIKEGIKIHRNNCPNAPQMKERFPYRVIKARWKDTTSRSSFLTTLFVSGTDELGIVSEISHIIAKDIGTQMRSINIESDKGLFEGILKVLVYNLDHLEFLIHKLEKVKGVISVTRGEK
ncbi:MAG: bifunctional (p)ppGpp synthetase/guanosine-3',5'-bis(diphosphate) 3'-pyrophosphohydrolase [Prolixibacteraceae bacterium]|jgi:GTP diphosphokinase / guanosine-3',5'-bis(diphosphate) 3'-diphosphatase|nr:bifunctional (p)ppGpp synthetase/guanosine-3',5'-bis(diphosphate) 3'-pyrophosphohydrolase [Prolixibacteraceae bacterium]MBT7000410.1 bifunctional (p)ppGpp synthetase/guanosine-3',5'-bis(diphosphate) 3'-pyrophosphohydrolase [Prolixibacteraceae bacterium]MBT7394001.1 bifunctional (p)ppGpp synthetase/guanosine-3',5'-bis(diphosphate) 3'-pyrophosphohydrolase [Prolixibacteraceae bacterium]